MANMPISVARNIYMQKVADITNTAHLPAFVIAEVLERTLAEVQKIAQTEYMQDLEAYRRETKAENENLKENHCDKCDQPGGPRGRA